MNQIIKPSHDQIENKVIFSTAEDLEKVIKRITFTARPWLPTGLVTLLVSSPGLGKTNIALDVARRLLKPELGWFDGQSLEGWSEKVVWCDTESFQGGLLGRINDLNIPKDRVVLPFPDPLREVRLDRCEDMEHLERVVREVGENPLLVIDSLRGSHRREENDSKQMQNILSNLSKLVQSCNINCLATHHTNKPPQGELDVISDINRIRGSSAIAANCRTIWALDQPDPQSARLRVHVIKSNLARKPDALALEITESGLKWTTDVPQQPGKASKKTKLGEAVDWLRETLEDGPKHVKEVEKQAKEEGISDMTLRRAKERPCFESIAPNKDHSYWRVALKMVDLRPSSYV